MFHRVNRLMSLLATGLVGAVLPDCGGSSPPTTPNTPTLAQINGTYSLSGSFSQSDLTR